MNAISKIKNISIILAISTSFFSCENNVEEESEIGGNPICDSDISFIASIKPIIDTNCIECHGGNQAPDLRTYEGISNNATRIQTQVVSRRMPQGGSLTNEEIELIRCWVENGALNN